MGNNTYSLVRDIKLMLKNINAFPTTFSYEKIYKNEMSTQKLPEVCGRFFMG